ncbi:MAG: PIG-L family deacetylase [Actinocatenispora sp.]
MSHASSSMRRTVDDVADDDAPVRLPHLEFDGADVRFLGEVLDPGAVPPDAVPLWESCDGSRPLSSWPEAARERILRWHAAGLVVAARPVRRCPAAPLTVVAPHPDDAQLALGAVLSTRGGRVLDVFSEETWTRRPYYQQRPALAAELLVAEERVACQVLRAQVALLGHVDGEARPAWRDGFFLDPDDDNRCAEREPELIERVVEDLAVELSADTIVLAPLAVGGHVDHVVTREAVGMLVARGDLDPGRLGYYEDMPYAVFSDPVRAAGHVADRTGVPLHALSVPATSDAARHKREALRCYRLQVPDGLARRVVRYGARLSDAVFTERLWVASPDGPVAALLG